MWIDVVGVIAVFGMKNKERRRGNGRAALDRGL